MNEKMRTKFEHLKQNEHQKYKNSLHSKDKQKQLMLIRN